MPIDNEVKQIKYRGRRYTFRYWASADQWVPVNQDGGLRSSLVPREVRKALNRIRQTQPAAEEG